MTGETGFAKALLAFLSMDEDIHSTTIECGLQSIEEAIEEARTEAGFSSLQRSAWQNITSDQKQPEALNSKFTHVAIINCMSTCNGTR